jgi:beta-xylosidase
VVSLPQPLHAAFHGKYRNPVNAGDFPDPSVIRVDRTFYAVTTSTDWAPFFPIFRSTDLIDWELVGHVFARRPDWCAGNFWAPDFAQKDGRFYVYYTARRKDGGLCVAVATADRPEGPYVDHGALIGQTCGSIDAMAADDYDGARWLLWKEDGNAHNKPTPIWAQRLSDDGLVLTGTPVELLRNDAPWEGRLVEAPHVIQRNGWYYMFYSGNACCGEDCAYAVGVSRSRAMEGPWEKCPRNPILASNDAFRCPGHGSPVDDGKGNWYYLYHAYEARPDAIYVGRQLCLDAIRWTPDGWPTINGGHGPSRIAETPFPSLERQAPQRARWTADFTGALDRGWQWPQSGTPSLEVDHGALKLTAQHPRRGSDPLAGVAARPVSTGDYAATATVATRDQRAGTMASLCAYGSHRDALGIGIRDGMVTVWRRRGGHLVELALARVDKEKIHLRVTALAGRAYRFAFSQDGRQWTTLGGRLDGSWLPPWDAGVRIALAVGGTIGASARFTALKFEPAQAAVTPIETRVLRRVRIREMLAKVTTSRRPLAKPV